MEQLNNTTARIHAWLMENFPSAKEQNVGLNDSLLESSIIDSMGALEIVLYLESEFDVEFLDEEMVADHFESILSIARLVEAKTGFDGDDAQAS